MSLWRQKPLTSRGTQVVYKSCRCKAMECLDWQQWKSPQGSVDQVVGYRESHSCSTWPGSQIQESCKKKAQPFEIFQHSCSLPHAPDEVQKRQKLDSHALCMYMKFTCTLARRHFVCQEVLHSSKDTFPRNYNTHMYVYMEMCTCQGS